MPLSAFSISRSQFWHFAHGDFMPLTLSVGVSRKLGLPNYSSIGASCHLEVELDAGLLMRGADDLQHHVRRAYAACRQAVIDELTTAQNNPPPDCLAHNDVIGRNRLRARSANGHSAAIESSTRCFASQRQIHFAEQLFTEIGGAENCALSALSHHLYDKPLEELTSVEASDLIDTLKGIKNGEVKLDELLAMENA
jgi:hypothetical protein